MSSPIYDYSDLRGLTDTVREFAAAVREGKRILLLAGPGDGAVAIAMRSVGLLPPMTDAEASSVAAAQNAARIRPTGRRPFRAPHHTCSWAGMFGGTRTCVNDEGYTFKRQTVGEVGLARHGVLMLDEVTEFKRSLIEAAGSHVDDSTLLIACALPCPCGMANHPTRKCTCIEAQRDRWTGRLGRIVADLNIETIIEMPHLTNDERANGVRCPSTTNLQAIANDG